MNALLDSYQYIVCIYVLYVAIKGRGRLYEFGRVREADREKVRQILRGIYFAVALLCGLDGVVSNLQSSLFRVEYLEDGNKVISQVANLSWWPDVTYEFLFHSVSGIVGLIVALLLAVLLVVRRHSD